MFQASHQIIAAITVSDLIFGHSSRVPLPVSSLHDMFLKFDGKIRFFFFNNEIGTDFDQELVCLATGNSPIMQRSVSRPSWWPGRLEESSEPFKYESDRSRIGHVDSSVNLEPNMAAILGGAKIWASILSCQIRWFALESLAFDRDKSLSVKEAGNVIDVYHIFPLKVFDEKVAKSGDGQCPIRKEAEGQSRAKQGASLGVRNEHELPPKGMMCSELAGNSERLPEMCNPYMATLYHIS